MHPSKELQDALTKTVRFDGILKIQKFQDHSLPQKFPLRVRPVRGVRHGPSLQVVNTFVPSRMSLEKIGEA